jgi:integrative and conjugative element protein (TIGR02256 family)
LYFEPWEVVERNWTPEKYLNRVLWWLAETALGTLHLEDQPLEPLYFQNLYEVILPSDFEEKILENQRIAINNILGSNYTLRLSFNEKDQKDEGESKDFCCIAISIQAIEHGVLEKFPYTLGELEQQLNSRNSSLLNKIKEKIIDITRGGGILVSEYQKVLLILRISLKRSDSSRIEKKQYQGFLCSTSLVELGKSLDILFKGPDGKYYHTPIIGSEDMVNLSNEFMGILVEPLGIKFSLTPKMARKFSGIQTDYFDFSGVIAGVGALGSHLAEIWSKEGWGSWIFIDPDYIQPHNITRHIAKDFQVGQNKAKAVNDLIQSNYDFKYRNDNAIAENIINLNDQLLEKICNTDIIVDASTTLYVPRELSRMDVKRATSVFITPSGLSSVLLLEDKDRFFRLNVLEAQYYSAILSNDWGSKHLVGNSSHLWVGSGCRDISLVISVELVQLHAAILARQLRLRTRSLEASIIIWEADSDTGTVSMQNISVSSSITSQNGAWSIIWNIDLRNKVREFRSLNLPNETGGILLGYIDQKTKEIYIVDILSAPPDSQGDTSGFSRGINGLKNKVDFAESCTARIVTYIGEWHSHPEKVSVLASEADKKVLQYLDKSLKADGCPAVMLIIGDNEEKWYVS